MDWGTWRAGIGWPSHVLATWNAHYVRPLTAVCVLVPYTTGMSRVFKLVMSSLLKCCRAAETSRECIFPRTFSACACALACSACATACCAPCSLFACSSDKCCRTVFCRSVLLLLLDTTFRRCVRKRFKSLDSKLKKCSSAAAGSRLVNCDTN